VVIGKHGYRLTVGAYHVLLHFEDDDLENVAIGDKVLVRACGVGLEIECFEDVKLNKMSPRLLENIRRQSRTAG
jgi:hypothetical protein